MAENEGLLAGWIQTGKNEELEHALRADPGLANAKTKDGISVLLLACYCRNDAAVSLLKKYKSALDIYEAACIGEIDMVRQLLSEEPTLLERPSPDGFSLLGYACFFNREEIAIYLVGQKANVNAASQNAFRVTPLHSVCAISQVSLARLLLKNGADVHAKQQSGYTALHSAALHGQQELVTLLISYGADPNALTDEGQTAYDLAEKNGHKLRMMNDE